MRPLASCSPPAALALALLDGPTDLDLARFEDGGLSLDCPVPEASCLTVVPLSAGTADAGVVERDEAARDWCGLLLDAALGTLLGRLRFAGVSSGERGRFPRPCSFEAFDDDAPCDEASTGLDGTMGVLELEASLDGPKLPKETIFSKVEQNKKGAGSR